MTAICPQCGHDDQAQNIQAVIQSGLRYWNNTAAYIGETGLNSQLRLDEHELRSVTRITHRQPEDAKSLSDHWTGGCLFMLIWFVIIGPILSISITFLGAALDFKYLGLFGLAIWFIPPFVIFIRRLFNPPPKESRAKYHEWHSRLDRIVDSARRLWPSLYYCHRDHVIFLPGSSSSAPPSKMYDYLVQEADRL